jgi:exonuclease SbcC
MAVMSKLLSKIKPKTLAEKVAELDQLAMAQLESIAMSDEPNELRRAAINLLDYGATLVGLASDCPIVALQKQARQRIAQLLDTNSLGLAQLTEEGLDLTAQFTIVGFCQNEVLLPQLLETCTDTQFLYRMASHGVFTRLRELAADKISDEAILKKLLKESRGKDKLVYNIVKTKCDFFRDLEKQTAQTQTDIEALCELLLAHSNRSFDMLFTSKADRLSKRWEHLAPHSPAVYSAIAEQAILVCQQTINAHVAEQLEVAERKAEEESATQVLQTIAHDLAALLAQLYAIDDSEPPRNAITVSLNECQQRRVAALALASSNPHADKQFSQFNEAIALQLELLEEHGSVPQQSAALAQQSATDDAYHAMQSRLKDAALLPKSLLPQTVVDARAAMADKQKQWAAHKQVLSNQLRHVNALIGKANGAIKDGQSSQAAGIRRSLEKKCLELTRVPPTVTAQLEQMDAALDKLLDWKQYAVQPKQQQMIDRMQALVTSNDNPEALASKIKHLQEEWKSISRGFDGQEHWERFHQLAEQAYQPCKLYFTEQAAVRLANLDKRRALVAQLTEYFTAQPWEIEDRESMDWALVEKLIVTAIRQWQSYAPTERKGNKPVQGEFDQILASMRKKLHEHREKNSQGKLQLIDQALQLSDMEDNRQAIDKVKQLQAQWKTIGQASRGDEQKLWRAFRKSCDIIFKKRQQQSNEFKIELQANKVQAMALQCEVQRLGQLTGQPLLDARLRVKECQQEFRRIGTLPKTASTSLNKQLYQSLQQFETAVAGQLEADKAQVWEDLFEANDKIRRAQLASDLASAETLQQQAKEFIDSVREWPKGGLAVLEHKMSVGADITKQDEYERALKTLCIRAEIFSDNPTPAEDKALRMQYQVSQLQESFGHSGGESGGNLQELVLAWVAAGPVATDLYVKLLARFRLST